MARLKNLKPRLDAISTQLVKVLEHNPLATPRQRGRGWMSRRAMWLSLHPLCCKCETEGRTAAAMEVDHVVPLHLGGKDDETNMQSLCTPCHKVKSAREAGSRISTAAP